MHEILTDVGPTVSLWSLLYKMIINIFFLVASVSRFISVCDLINSDLTSSVGRVNYVILVWFDQNPSNDTP